jgi:hypothetical protein
MLDEELRADAIKFLRSIDAAVDERSWKPFVEPTGPTDPREIARLVAKQEKRQKRAATPLIDEIDMLDDAIEADDLDGDDLLTKDADDGYGKTFGGDEMNVDDDSAFGMGKKRARKTLGRDKGGEETTLTRNGAVYSDFYSTGERTLFSFEDAADYEPEKSAVAKPKKKRRADEDGDACEENWADEAPKARKKARGAEESLDSDEKTEKKEAKKSAKKSAKKEAKNGDGNVEEPSAEPARKPKSRAKGKTNKSEEPSDDAAN